jgi:hypothetical protein
MNSQIHFKGFDPESDLRTKASASLNRVLHLAPYGSVAIVLLEKLDAGYHCSFDVYSKFGPFIANANCVSADTAIAQVEDKLKIQLDIWRQRKNAAAGKKISKTSSKTAGPQIPPKETDVS